MSNNEKLYPLRDFVPNKQGGLIYNYLKRNTDFVTKIVIRKNANNRNAPTYVVSEKEILEIYKKIMEFRQLKSVTISHTTIINQTLENMKEFLINKGYSLDNIITNSDIRQIPIIDNNKFYISDLLLDPSLRSALREIFELGKGYVFEKIGKRKLITKEQMLGVLNEDSINYRETLQKALEKIKIEFIKQVERI